METDTGTPAYIDMNTNMNMDKYMDVDMKIVHLITSRLRNWSCYWFPL